ncbi:MULTISPECIES: helix-turn-helix transcriptional regulator [Staphylococcus]|uniref:helix-turn-helix transcriptional regulator n=2 Tax=Bacillota TaxID=1239 RepID=UPI00298F1B86|nr:MULTISPECIES: helix-turn-helix transcriptional regulator [Staphylococcus]MDW8556211.1 helix-turn-helix transcriptional regulator [Staphylococcus xylosus]
MQLNHKLKMERLNRRLSRESLAKSLNKFFKTTYYTERKIGLIESNEAYLKFDVINQICSFLNLTIQDFLYKKWFK